MPSVEGKLALVIPLLFAVGCSGVDADSKVNPVVLPETTPTASATATVTATFMPTKTSTPSLTPTTTKTETPRPTITRTATRAVATKILPSPTATKEVGPNLKTGSELPQDDTDHAMQLGPGEWAQLTIKKNGTTDVFIKNDPAHQIDVIIQSPQQANQTNKFGEPIGSRGSPCNNKTDCNTIVLARGPENGKYTLYLHNTKANNVSFKIRAAHGEGGCPAGTHNSGPYEEYIGGKLVNWIGWCVND